MPYCLGLEEGPFQNLTSYTEVIQDGMVRLLKSGKLSSASATHFRSAQKMMDEVNANMSLYSKRIVLRHRKFPIILRSFAGWASSP